MQPTSPGIDSWGNLIDRSPVNGKTLTEGLNCLANTNNQLTTCSLTYDLAGNLIQNGNTAYTYDAENRLIATAGMSYLYDGDGKRVEKCTEGTTAGTCATNAAGTLYWTAWGSDPLAETDLAGNVLENYIFFNGRRIARREPNPVMVHFYFSDHLGTHSLITDVNGDMPAQEESTTSRLVERFLFRAATRIITNLPAKNGMPKLVQPPAWTTSEQGITPPIKLDFCIPIKFW